MSFQLVAREHPIIPVATVSAVDQALPLARALYKGGISIIEITLRSEFGLAAIEAIRQDLPEILVGAGSVRNAAEMSAAVRAGAQFLVSPGATRPLLDAACGYEIPYLPAASTVSEIMTLLDAGYQYQKIFPVTHLGGTSFLKSLSGPLETVSFCPSGGVGPDNFVDYLSLPNVSTVSGTWLTTGELMSEKNWPAISNLTRESLSKLTL